MEKIQIGQIVNVVGLKGEVKVYHYCDSKERFEELSQVYLEDQTYWIDKVRYHKDLVILKLKGVDDRTQAENLKGKAVLIGTDDLKKLPEDTYYIRDMIGLVVIDEQDRQIGRLNNVIKNIAQDLYEIEMENGKKILIPAVEEFVLKIDIQNGLIKVKLIEGLLEI